MRPGEIHFHRRFYVDTTTGEFRGKYLLALAVLPGGDLVVRLLTSRQYGRPKDPLCFHGDPYPAFYLGVVGGPLQKESWLDLRRLDDFDAHDVARQTTGGELTLAVTLEGAFFRQAAECAAAANDTTRLQERAIRNQLALLGSSRGG